MKFFNQIHIKYASIMGGLLILCLIYMETTGQSFLDKSPVFPIFMFVGSFVLWFLGIKASKDKADGKLSYKHGLITGLKISLVFSIVSPIIFLLYYLINPQAIEDAKTIYQVQEQSSATIIIMDLVIQVVTSFMLGAIYSAIIPLFLKTKK